MFNWKILVECCFGITLLFTQITTVMFDFMSTIQITFVKQFLPNYVIKEKPGSPIILIYL